MSDITNIVLCGVGGQGSVVAGQIIARAAVLTNLRVTTSEVHGMAQRGGSVFSTARFGQDVYSPVISVGEADYLVSFEELEAVRYVRFLRPGGVVLLNQQRISPTIEALKTASYPRDVVDLLSQRARLTLMVPGLAKAAELGNARLANSVVLGALSWFLPLPEEAWRHALSELVPATTVELNLRAFDEGRRWIQDTQLSAEAPA